jgi:hypothetical protein
MTPRVNAAYQDLLPFHTAKVRLQAERAKIVELESVFQRLGIEGELGMCLLHTHIKLASDEYLTRSFSGRSITIKPAALTCQLPYMWALQKIGGEYIPTAVEFFMPSQCTASLEVISKKIEATCYRDNLAVVGETLDRLGCRNLFGISLLPSYVIMLRQNETFLECEIGDRCLAIDVVHREMLLDRDTTNTLWTFPTNILAHMTSGSVICAVHCPTHCYDHHQCESHCDH